MTLKQKRKQRTIISLLNDTLAVIRAEFRTMFKDRGVVIMLVLAPLAYPVLYGLIYKNETLTKVPVAAVDCSKSQNSRELLRHMDATQSVQIAYRFNSLEEAKKAFNKKMVHGVVYIPADFAKKLNYGDQTTVSIYCDISSFMYYRIINQACTNCILDMNKRIQLDRLNANGIAGEEAEIIANPVQYSGTALYNEGAGFASFLLPALLIIILQQTLFLGIGMITGTSREENRFHELVSTTVHREKILRVIIGKSSCYFALYGAWSFFMLGVIPHVFDLPHIGISADLILFIIPFLFSVIFFSMTVSVFLPNRETGMMLFLSFSLVLLFISGFSWPPSNIHWFWKTFAWIFPSTSGVQGYLKINTMAGTLRTVSQEYISLWIQTGLYFMTTYLTYRWQIKRSSKKLDLKSEPEYL